MARSRPTIPQCWKEHMSVDLYIFIVQPSQERPMEIVNSS